MKNRANKMWNNSVLKTKRTALKMKLKIYRRSSLKAAPKAVIFYFMWGGNKKKKHKNENNNGKYMRKWNSPEMKWPS